MEIELGTPMLLEPPSSGERIKGVFMGGAPHRQMLVGIPLNNGTHKRLRDTKKCVVRYLFDGRLYGFQADVLDFKLSPTPMLFLTWPKQGEQLDIRKFDRVRCNIPIGIRGGRGVARGLIVDLSAGGCRLLFQGDSPLIELETDTRIKAEFYVLDPDNPYTMRGILAHKEIKDGRLHLGIRFEGNDERSQKAIETYVDHVMTVLG